MISACTIVVPNYLAYARVLAASFLTHHPDSQFRVLPIDDEDGSAGSHAADPHCHRLRDIGLVAERFIFDFLPGEWRNVLPALGDRPVTSIRRQDCRELIARCRGSGIEGGHGQGVLRSLSAILTQAVEDDLLQANPALRTGRCLRQGDEPETAYPAAWSTD